MNFLCRHFSMFQNTQLQVRWLCITRQSWAKPSNSKKGKGVLAQKWLHRHLSDPYVKRARIESYRCRSAFKLIEMDERFRLLKPGDIVIDCGAAPGSWSEVAVRQVNAGGLGDRTALSAEETDKIGTVIGVDIQHMAPVEGATILYNSDFTTLETQEKILKILEGRKVHTVMSDMAPNATGLKSMDHELIIALCLSALKFSLPVLKDGGTFLGKIWQGNQQARLESLMKTFFKTVRVVKPNASRNDSAEVFLLARNFKK